MSDEVKPLTPEQREAIRAQAQKLLDNPRGLSPEVIAWAMRWFK